MAPSVLENTTTPAATKPVQNGYMPSLPAKTANKPVEIKPSAAEIARGSFNDANTKLFLSGMHRDGIVILKDIIDPSHLDQINAFMIEDTKKELEKGAALHRNFGVENIQQGPPITPDKYFFDDIYLNPLLFHAATLYLGPNATWNMITGNNALPHGTKRQPAHSDAMCDHPPCPFYAIANVYTVDASPANGSTEIWLGTHTFDTDAQTLPGPSGETYIRPEFTEVRGNAPTLRPGFQPTVNKGSVLFRDMRLWHAGMPNPSDDMRFMIALGFSASWWHGTARFRVPAKMGVFERIMHGTKGHGVVPVMEEVGLEAYESASRNAHDFSDVEKRTFEGEVF